MQRKMLWAVGVAVVALLAGTVPGVAMVNVGVNPSNPWIGWMNVFDLPVGSGGYLFGSPWGTGDLPAVFTGSQLELGPNTNVYNAADPFWVNPDGTGAKWMNANFYVEDTSLLGETVVFSGETIENTFVAGYTSQAFIKVLDSNAGFSTVAEVYAPLVTGQPFSLTLAVDNVPGYIPQFGFVTDGADANPATSAALGHVLVVPEPAALALLALGGLAALRRRTAR